MIKLSDIAEQVGTSVAAVSCVLNNRLGKIRVSEEKKKHILQVADELGYAPNRSARALVTSVNRTLGLVVGTDKGKPFTIHDTAYTFSILSGMGQECEPLGYRCVYAPSDMRDMESFTLPDFVRDRSVDGVVLAGYVHPEVEETMRKRGIPLVHIGTNISPESQLHSVSADMVEGTCRVLDQAYAAGIRHVHIHMPAGPGPEGITRGAIAYAEEHYAKLKVSCRHEEFKGFNRLNSHRHGIRLAKQKNRPELVLTSVAYIHALYGGMRESGVTCPDQIHMIAYAPEGYHNEPLGDTTTSLAQVVLPFVEIGRSVAKTLIQKEKKSIRKKKDEYVKCHYLKGESASFLN